MIEYFKRVMTYDPKTQNYIVECPEIGLKVQGDTEMSAMLAMREEIQAEAPRLAKNPAPELKWLYEKNMAEAAQELIKEIPIIYGKPKHDPRFRFPDEAADYRKRRGYGHYDVRNHLSDSPHNPPRGWQQDIW